MQECGDRAERLRAWRRLITAVPSAAPDDFRDSVTPAAEPSTKDRSPRGHQIQEIVITTVSGSLVGYCRPPVDLIAFAVCSRPAYSLNGAAGDLPASGSPSPMCTPPSCCNRLSWEPKSRSHDPTVLGDDERRRAMALATARSTGSPISVQAMVPAGSRSRERTGHARLRHDLPGLTRQTSVVDRSARAWWERDIEAYALEERWVTPRPACRG